MSWWMAMAMEDVQYGLVVIRQLELGGEIVESFLFLPSTS